MAKFKVTRKGVYDSSGKALEIGAIIEAEKMPAHLVNKAIELDLEVATPKSATKPTSK